MFPTIVESCLIPIRVCCCEKKKPFFENGKLEFSKTKKNKQTCFTSLSYTRFLYFWPAFCKTVSSLRHFLSEVVSPLSRVSMFNGVQFQSRLIHKKNFEQKKSKVFFLKKKKYNVQGPKIKLCSDINQLSSIPTFLTWRSVPFATSL